MAKSSPTRQPRQTEVLDGLRSPSQMAARMGMATTDGREPNAHVTPSDMVVPNINMKHLQPPMPHGKRTIWHFRSRIRRLMVLIGAFPDTTDARGRLVRGDTRHAKFEDWEYTTKNREEAEILMENADCRIGGLYWDADMEDHIIANTQYDSFAASLRRNPELAHRFSKAIQSGDFDDVIDKGAEMEMAEAAFDAEGKSQQEGDGEGAESDEGEGTRES